MGESVTGNIEKGLNAVCRACGYLASLFVVMTLVAVLVNIVDRIFGSYTAGTNEFASYCVGAAGTLGLAYCFGEGKHIRMTLLLNRTQGAVRKTMEVLSLLIAAGLSSFMSYYLVKMVVVSALLDDRSTGSDEILLWIPQAPMAFGFLVLSLSLIHRLLRELKPAGRTGEQAPCP